jgi:glycosyltransferase involved in cell wall biosynthesis
MNIAQITQHYLPIVGGQEVYIDQLNRVFNEAGWNNMVYQPDTGIRRNDITSVFRLRGVSRIVNGAEPHLFNLFLNHFYRAGLIKNDIIIAHYAVHALPLLPFAQRVIVLSHGVEWALSGDTWNDRRRGFAAKACFNEFPHVVNDTHYLRENGMDIKAGTGYFTEVAPRKWFIPNCVNTNRFRKTAGLPEWRGRRILLVPRQVTQDRGIDLAIRSFALVHKNEPSLELVILGKMWPGAYLELCHKLVCDYGLKSHVFFKEHIGNNEMADYYSSAELTLIPTLRREGTSLSAIESMCCGTATVSTNVCGLADLPTVQSPPNEIDFAQAIEDTLKNKVTIATQQCEVARQLFRYENWAKTWLHVINAVAASQK